MVYYIYILAVGFGRYMYIVNMDYKATSISLGVTTECRYFTCDATFFVII